MRNFKQNYTIACYVLFRFPRISFDTVRSTAAKPVINLSGKESNIRFV